MANPQNRVKFLLNWNHFQEHLTNSMARLMVDSTFSDVIIATADKRMIYGHKFVLANSSKYFNRLMKQMHRQRGMHLVVALPEIKYDVLKILMNYMYRGETQVAQDLLPTVIRAGRLLEINGLVDLHETDSIALGASIWPYIRGNQLGLPALPANEQQQLVLVENAQQQLAIEQQDQPDEERQQQLVLLENPHLQLQIRRPQQQPIQQQGQLAERQQIVVLQSPHLQLQVHRPQQQPIQLLNQPEEEQQQLVLLENPHLQLPIYQPQQQQPMQLQDQPDEEQQQLVLLENPHLRLPIHRPQQKQPMQQQEQPIQPIQQKQQPMLLQHQQPVQQHQDFEIDPQAATGSTVRTRASRSAGKRRARTQNADNESKEKKGSQKRGPVRRFRPILPKNESAAKSGKRESIHLPVKRKYSRKVQNRENPTYPAPSATVTTSMLKTTQEEMHVVKIKRERLDEDLWEIDNQQAQEIDINTDIPFEIDEMNNIHFSELFCDICQVSYSTHAEWLRHSSHAREQMEEELYQGYQEPEDNEADNEVPKEVYKCVICSEAMHSASDWIQHIRSRHTDAEPLNSGLARQSLRDRDPRKYN